MNPRISQQLRNRKRRIDRRLDKTKFTGKRGPMFTATNIHYEISDRLRGLAHGGIGAFALLVKRLGLAEAIVARESILRHIAAFKAGLAGPDASPLERVLVDAAALAWVEANYASAADAQNVPRSLSPAQQELMQKRTERAPRAAESRTAL